MRIRCKNKFATRNNENRFSYTVSYRKRLIKMCEKVREIFAKDFAKDLRANPCK